MTTDSADTETYGRLYLEFPPIDPDAHGAMPAWKVRIVDADTGDPVTCATGAQVTISLDPQDLATVDLVVVLNEDGNLHEAGQVVALDGDEPRTELRRYWLAGVRPWTG